MGNSLLTQIVGSGAFIVLIWVAARSGWRKTAERARPRPGRRRAICCVVAGGGILIIVCAATLTEAMFNPSWPAPPHAGGILSHGLRPSRGVHRQESDGDHEYACAFILASVSPHAVDVVRAQRVPFAWPLRGDLGLRATLEPGIDHRVGYAASVESVDSAGERGEVQWTGSVDLHGKWAGADIGKRTKIDAAGLVHLGYVGRSTVWRRVPGAAVPRAGSEIHAFCFVKKNEGGDRHASLALQPGAFCTAITGGGQPAAVDRDTGLDTGATNELTQHVGLALLAVLAAAALFGQVFRNKVLGFAVALLPALIYVALLDRAAVAISLARAADPALAPERRAVAAAQAAETFFYRESASSGLRAIAGDPSAPDEVRLTADRAARWVETANRRLTPAPRERIAADEEAPPAPGG